MKRLWFLFFCLQCVLSIYPALADDDSNEYLVVNNPKVRRFSYSIGNVTIGNPEVVNFKADRKDNRITLIPKEAGTTLLVVYDSSGRQRDAIALKVYPSDPESLLSQVKQLLVDVEGISVKRLDDKVIIDGDVILPSDKERIRRVAGNAKNIIDLTKLNPDTNDIVAKKIQKEIGMDEVSVRSLKGRILLEGEVYSKAAFQKAEKIASLYADKIINALEIRELPEPPAKEQTVQVTAHFVEVAKNFSKNFNFRWNPIPKVGTSLAYTLNPITGKDNFTGAISGTMDDILPKLNYFKALGVARVMENPTVSVTHGKTAIIESGTRIGFPIVQANGTVSMEFQNVGSTLQVTPFIRGTEIDLQINLKVSSLGSPDINGGIAIQQNSVQTRQFVKSGESVAIGGLVRFSNRQSVDRPPPVAVSGNTSPQASGTGNFEDPFPLGSLFTLFKSNDIGKQRSQFIVFITPTIMQFAKDANRELKEQFNLYEVYPENLQKNPTQNGELDEE